MSVKEIIDRCEVLFEDIDFTAARVESCKARPQGSRLFAHLCAERNYPRSRDVAFGCARRWF